MEHPDKPGSKRGEKTKRKGGKEWEMESDKRSLKEEGAKCYKITHMFRQPPPRSIKLTVQNK